MVTQNQEPPERDPNDTRTTREGEPAQGQTGRDLPGTGRDMSPPPTQEGEQANPPGQEDLFPPDEEEEEDTEEA